MLQDGSGSTIKEYYHDSDCGKKDMKKMKRKYIVISSFSKPSIILYFSLIMKFLE